jgi:predicted transposase/invertase (TIGR01784 family)
MIGRHKRNKKSNVDVLVMMNNGTFVNIEAQRRKQEKFHKRSHFYNSKIYSIFLNEGKDYDELPMSIMINILDFNLLKSENYHHAFILYDKINKKYTIGDILETHYIELPKLRKKVKTGNIDLNNPKIRLLLLLDEKTPQKLIQKVINMDKNVNNIYQKALNALQNQKEYLSYIRAEQAELDYKAQLKYAEKTGVKKGKFEGKVEGKADSKIEIAIKLKKLDITLEKIAEITGIPVEEIEEL